MSKTKPQRPLRIGLTGGIASGKSTVADLFFDLGVDIIDTDVIARDLVQPGEPALMEIQRQFGDKVVDESGRLDRRAMRTLVFSNDDARSALEAILHPRIGSEVKRLSRSHESTYQIIVVPLLVDSPLLQFVDRVLVVDCSEETQLNRLMQRDSGSIEEARRILAAQSNREDRLKIADDVIHNNSGLEHLLEQVMALDEMYLGLTTPPCRHEQ